MTVLEVVIASVRVAAGAPGRAAVSFFPASMPLLARRSYAVELVTTLFFAMTLAAIEGGFIGVFTKQTYADVAPDRWLNFAVAFIAAAPELANILSFFWVSLAHGKPKVPWINGLQLAVVVLVGLIPFVPRTDVGLMVLAAVVVSARACWSGIIALRPTVWRQNYPRAQRARIVGKFTTVQQIVVASVALGLGALLDMDGPSAETAISVAAGLGIIAVIATSRQRVRGEKAVLGHESGELDVTRPWEGPAIVMRVLRQDVRYAQFQACLFVLGFGNLMLTPLLVIALKDQFGVGYVGSIMVTLAIPYLLMPLAIPLWARLLDRSHVVKFRSLHGWSFVFSTGAILLAVETHSLELMYVAAVLQGIAFGGGTLAWNLGHVDFAPPSRTSQYMAAHLTLNGIRGLIAPLFAVAAYEYLLKRGHEMRTASAAVLMLSLVLCVIGSAGFVVLRRSMGAGAVNRR